MPQLIQLETFNTGQGNLNAIEKAIPGSIKRVFYIYGAENASRGGHRHHTTYNALICIQGSCHVFSTDGENEEDFILDSPDTCLVLEPKDWHIMDNFSENAILLVLSNQYYDRADYIDDPYIQNQIASSGK